MIIYNVTINIDDSVHDQWLNWLKTKHIGEVLATGCFYKAKLSKVLVEEEMGGTTYSIQYAAESKEQLQEYYKTFAPKLREEGLHMFGDKMLAFRTELEVINEFYNNKN
ncbi:MAG: hypothetical protein CK517_02875 [Flavobacteriales bacterium]|nr:MAG: hypothetical protein CK517_02875 [Flavobacteriales bacterium]